jgi:hypothetical protein
MPPKTKRRSSSSGTSLTPHERGQTETGIDAPEIAIRLRGKDVPNPQKTSVVQVQTPSHVETAKKMYGVRSMTHTKKLAEATDAPRRR